MVATDKYTAPDFDRAALITIDLQRCTLNGQSFEIPGTSDTIPLVAALAEVFRAKKLPIVHVIRLYRPDGSNADLCRREQLQSGAGLVLVATEGRLPVSEILPTPDIALDDERLLSGNTQDIGPNEWVIYKPRWGAFYGTSLEEHLRDLNVSTIVLAGCNYPNCPRATLYEASERDFRLVAIKDGMSMFDQRGQQELEDIGVTVIDSANCISAIRSVTSAINPLPSVTGPA